MHAWPTLSYILDAPRGQANQSSFRRDIEALSSFGYEGLEIQMRGPDDFADFPLRALLEDRALRLVAIQTGSAYLDRGICLASPDAAVRRSAVCLLERYIEFAADFGATVVFGLLQGTRRDEPVRELALARIRENLHQLAAQAESAGVLLAMEPVNRYECCVFHNTVADVLESVAALGSPAIRGMVDTFHVNIEERSQRQAILEAAPVLAHVHLSETNRGLFGTGHLDFAEVRDALCEARYSGFVSVGVYRDQPPVAERARHSIEWLAARG